MREGSNLADVNSASATGCGRCGCPTKPGRSLCSACAAFFTGLARMRIAQENHLLGSSAETPISATPRAL
jgi:hypothetical protein